MKTTHTIVLILVALTTGSCVKNTERPATVSTSCYFLGISANALNDTIAFLCTAGQKSPLSGQIPAFTNTLFTKQAVVAAALDYWIPGTVAHDSGRTMRSIFRSNGTAIKEIHYSGNHTLYPSLVYDDLNPNFFALSSIHVVALSFSDSTFNDVQLIQPINSIRGRHSSLTIDPNTEHIYFCTTRGSHLFIEQFIPGDSTCKITANLGTGYQELVGLLFNGADNQLYGIATLRSTGANQLIKVDPKNGSVRVLNTIQDRINTNYFSSVISYCDNAYLFSATYTNGINTFQEFDTSGKCVRLDTTANLFQGLMQRVINTRNL